MGHHFLKIWEEVTKCPKFGAIYDNFRVSTLTANISGLDEDIDKL